MSEVVIKNLSWALKAVSELILQFLPRLVAMVIIFVVGWVVELILRRLLVLVRLNKLFESKGITQLLTEAALPSPAEIISRIVFWAVWVCFMLVGVNALGIGALQREISAFVALLPQFIV